MKPTLSPIIQISLHFLQQVRQHERFKLKLNLARYRKLLKQAPQSKGEEKKVELPRQLLKLHIEKRLLPLVLLLTFELSS